MDVSEALEFAASRHNGVLVTQKRDGRPQLSNITYVVVDGVVKISVTATRAKYTNLVRNPQSSLYVCREDFWGYVVIEGDADMSDVATSPDEPGIERDEDPLSREVGGTCSFGSRSIQDPLPTLADCVGATSGTGTRNRNDGSE